MKEMLEHFCMTELSPKHPTVILNGFFPMLTLDDLVKVISHKVVQGYYGVDDVPQALTAKLEFFASFFSRNDISLILMIHSLDELIRLNKPIWDAICERLAVAGANVHLLVSVDHHFAPTGIPASQPFVWFPCPTGVPYNLELAFKSHSSSTTSSISGKHDSILDEESALRILTSLPQRAILIFCLFSNLALRDDVGPNGVVFDLLLEKTRLTEQMDFKSFETQLNQFQAHRLLKRNLKTQTIMANLEKTTLQKVLDTYEDLWIIYAADLL
jgi:hypothetical protein